MAILEYHLCGFNSVLAILGPEHRTVLARIAEGRVNWRPRRVGCTIAFLSGRDYHIERRIDSLSQGRESRMRRILYAALAGLVFVLAVLVGTVISAVFLNGVEL